MKELMALAFASVAAAVVAVVLLPSIAMAGMAVLIAVVIGCVSGLAASTYRWAIVRAVVGYLPARAVFVGADAIPEMAEGYVFEGTWFATLTGQCIGVALFATMIFAVGKGVVAVYNRLRRA